MLAIDWGAIKYISGVASLTAFVAATIATVARQWIKSREKLISLAPSEYRPRLIDRALGAAIPVDDLAKKDRRDLFLIHLRHRERQLMIILTFVVILAVLATTTFLLAPRPRENAPEFGILILDQWKEDQRDFIKEFGLPADDREISVWFQFFTNGVILYNTVGNTSWVLEYETRRYRKINNPDRLISEHHKKAIDWALFTERANGAQIDASQLDSYRALIESRKIIGGIGTLFVSYALLPNLGEPQALPNTLRGVHVEDFMSDVLHSRGPNYELVAGLPNRAADNPTNRLTRAVVALFRDGTYRKFIVILNEKRRAIAARAT